MSIFKKEVEKSPEFKKAQDAIKVIQGAYAMCWALGELVRQNKQAVARAWIAKMWKAYRHYQEASQEDKNGIDEHMADSVELVLDEFFNHSGDMAKASTLLESMLKRQCPENLWDSFRNGLVESRETALRMVTESQTQLLESAKKRSEGDS